MARAAAVAVRKLAHSKSEKLTKVNGGVHHSKDKKIAVFANFRPRAGDKLTPKEWATKINATWQRSTESLLETARLIREARGDLPVGKYKEMQKYLDMGEADVSKLYSIGCCEVFYKKQNMPKLPPKYSVLYLLSLIPAEALQKLFDKGDIHLNMTRKCADELKKKYKLLAQLQDDPDEGDEDYAEDESDNDNEYEEPETDNDEEVDEPETDNDEEDEPEVETKPAPAKSNAPPKEGFELHLENWHNGVLSQIEFCDALEEYLKQGKRIPQDKIKDALRLSALLKRMCEQYK